MRSKLDGLKATVFGVLLPAALVLTAAASASISLTGPGTIRITDRLVKRTHVDGGKPGPGAGDFDFYRQLLYNTRITKTSIGHSDLTCVHTGTGSSNCTGTYFLPKGKIMVAGVIASRLFYEQAVIGGTGLYDNVKGTLTVTYFGGKPATELLIFRLSV
jgi:hypothetical protein